MSAFSIDDRTFKIRGGGGGFYNETENGAEIKEEEKRTAKPLTASSASELDHSVSRGT